MAKWTEELKAGDLVLVCNRVGVSLRKVDKITPKGFIKVGCALYNPQTGWERTSDTWSMSTLKQATPEAIEEYKRNSLIKSTLNVMRGLKEITYEQAIEIRKILNINNEGR